MILEDIKTYAQDCISGKIISGQKHKWACERFLKDTSSVFLPIMPRVAARFTAKTDLPVPPLPDAI